MTYRYENLSPERFQHFCQSLLAASFPNLQCLPVGQPDGGRDAFAWIATGSRGSSNRKDFIVFQVKFHRRPFAEPDPHKWLLKVLSHEAPKLRDLIPKGASKYYLLTNVPGTAHLEAGSIDRVATILRSASPIPAFCWWRDDLDRRVDDRLGLKWSNPEILTGTDILQYVVHSNLSEDQARRTDAIRAYLSDQYSADEEVRFKQVELQNTLLDLFVDVPLVIRASTAERHAYIDFDYLLDKQRRMYELHAAETGDLIPASYWEPTGRFREARRVEAATACLDSRFQEQFPKVVIEGAPGQGKSTITQYICQVHRMRLLGKLDEIARIPSLHRETPVRLPMRVDLRDLTTWFSGRNPFSGESDNKPPPNWFKSLEAFLAGQIEHHSGGIRFSTADLSAVASLSAVVLVLDGFDEVADIARRNEIVEEIVKGVRRLDAVAIDLQVIITSRPAAFANSPGCPKSLFQYLELASLIRG